MRRNGKKMLKHWLALVLTFTVAVSPGLSAKADEDDLMPVASHIIATAAEKNESTFTANKQAMGSVEATGGLGEFHVSGWAYDPDDTAAQVRVLVYVGGDTAQDIPCYQLMADQNAPSVNRQLGISGDHAFSGTIRTNLTGDVPLFIYAMDLDGTDKYCMYNRTVFIKANHMPIGSIDGLFCDKGALTIRGWAYDPDDEDAKIDIIAYYGGEPSPSTPATLRQASKSREDVNDAYGISGNHGFDFTVCPDTTGTIPVYVYAVDAHDPWKKSLLGKKNIKIDPYIPVSDIRIIGYHKYLSKVGDSMKLSTSILPTNATIQAHLWKSSNTEVVTVGSDGRMTATGEGMAVVSVHTEDGDFSDYCLVHVGNGNLPYGDFNGDGRVTATDLSTINQAIGTEMQEPNHLIYDLNGDGKADKTDVSLVSEYIVKLIDRFPVMDALRKVSIFTMPLRTAFYYPEDIDYTGLQLIATYGDGTQKTVAPTSTPSHTGSSRSSKVCQVIYTEGAVTFKTQVTIRNLTDSLALNLSDQGARADYVSGEVFDTKGLYLNYVSHTQAFNGIDGYIAPKYCLSTSDDKIVIQVSNLYSSTEYQEISFPIRVKTCCESYGHFWGVYQPDSAGQAHTRKCSICGSSQTEQCSYIRTQATEATCIAPGYHTLTCKKCGNSYQQIDDGAPARGHDYRASSFSWYGSGDNTSCRITLTCDDCAEETTGHTKYETGVVTASVTKLPTCTESGTKTYTASCQSSGIRYSDTKTEILPASGHHFAWVEITPATESAPGTEREICSGCGMVRNSRDISYDGPYRLDSSRVTVEAVSDMTYTGESICPTATIFYDQKKLTEGIDYTVSYQDNIDHGFARIIFTGKGDYEGARTAAFTILAKSIQNCMIDEIPTQAYIGSAVQPEVRVSDGLRVLSRGLDYDLAYSDNTAPGTAKILVTGLGNYKHIREITFKIQGECVHEWSDMVIKQSTCTEKGEKTRTCQHCGETVHAEIEPLGHLYVLTNKKPASYEEDGEEVFVCSRCGDSYRKTVPRLSVEKLDMIELSESKLKLQIGDENKLGIKTSPADRNGYTLKGYSGNEKVATISDDGLVKAVGAGTTEVGIYQVGFEQVRAFCEVTVVGGSDEMPEEKDIECQIYFDANGGRSSHSKKMAVIGKPYGSIFPEVKRDRYELLGWYTHPVDGLRVNEASVVEAEEDKDINGNFQRRLYARWERVRWKVYFYNGISETPIIQEITDGETVTDMPDAPEITAFIGWYNMDTNIRWDPTKPVTKELRIIARSAKADGRGDDSVGRSSGKDTLIISKESDAYLVRNQSYAFPSTYQGGNMDGKLIEWKSTNPAVIRISGKYKAKALKGTNEGSSNKVYVYDEISPDTSSMSYAIHIVDPWMGLTDGANISMLKGTVSMLPAETKQLAIGGLHELSDMFDVVWQSSNEEVAKVDGGEVLAIAKGSAKISAYINGRVFTASIKVVDANKVSSFEREVELTPLQTVSVRFSDGFKVKKAFWESDLGLKPFFKRNGNINYYEDKVVRITQAGKITAIGVGTTTLTARAEGTEKVFKITVKEPSTAIIYLNVGKSRSLKYFNVKAGSSTAQWSTSDPSVTSDAKKGKIKGLKEGRATIVCRYDPYAADGISGTGFLFTATVYVENVRLKTEGNLVEKKAGSTYTLSMDIGDTVYLQTTGNYQPIIFASGKPKVAFIDENGLISARSKGKATLSARVNGKKITIAVTVR